MRSIECVKLFWFKKILSASLEKKTSNTLLKIVWIGGCLIKLAAMSAPFRAKVSDLMHSIDQVRGCKISSRILLLVEWKSKPNCTNRWMAVLWFSKNPIQIKQIIDSSNLIAARSNWKEWKSQKISCQVRVLPRPIPIILIYWLQSFKPSWLTTTRIFLTSIATLISATTNWISFRSFQIMKHCSNTSITCKKASFHYSFEQKFRMEHTKLMERRQQSLPCPLLVISFPK